MKILLIIGALMLAGCTKLTVEEQARSMKVCRDAGFNSEVVSNELTTNVVSIHCVPTKEAKP